MQPKPNFLVIGAGRSGTTSLHHYLGRHPDIFIPAVKSPSYFYAVDSHDMGRRRRRETRNYFIEDTDSYMSLFAESIGFAARGEVSPAYLSSARVPDRIASELEGVKVIAILRNPTERVIARFIARRRDGLEPLPSISQVISTEMNAGLDLADTAGTYIASGFVSQVLDRYIEKLGRERVSLHLYDDFVVDNRPTLAEMFRFLGVDPAIEVETSMKHNSSKGLIAQPAIRLMWQGSAAVRQIIRPLVPSGLREAAFHRITRNTSPVAIDLADRRLLDEIYTDEVWSLSRLLDRDLSHWKSPE